MALILGSAVFVFMFCILFYRMLRARTGIPAKLARDLRTAQLFGGFLLHRNCTSLVKSLT